MSSSNLDKQNSLNRPSSLNDKVEQKEERSQEVEGGKLQVGTAVESEVLLAEGELETMGRVSEILGENVSENQNVGITGSKTQAKAQTREERIENLLKKAPSPSVMKQEIKKTLNSEYKAINQKVGVAKKNGDFFEMTRLVARMRKIKETLSKLMRAPIKMIKELWLKIVHGEQL